jgi:hypothetical protein
MTLNPSSLWSILEGIKVSNSVVQFILCLVLLTIHKTIFLPVQIGLTATFTPHPVAWLGRKGWVGSAGTKRATQEMRKKIKHDSERNPGSVTGERSLRSLHHLPVIVCCANMAFHGNYLYFVPQAARAHEPSAPPVQCSMLNVVSKIYSIPFRTL